MLLILISTFVRNDDSLFPLFSDLIFEFLLNRVFVKGTDRTFNLTEMTLLDSNPGPNTYLVSSTYPRIQWETILPFYSLLSFIHVIL